MSGSGLWSRWSTQPTDLVIVGAGGHGRETRDAAVGQWAVAGFVDDQPGPAVIGTVDSLRDWTGLVAVGIGGGHSRRMIVQRLAGLGHGTAVTITHPSAVIGSDTTFGVGCFVGALAFVSTDVVLGDWTHVNAGSLVHHDGRIGAFVTISPGSTVNGNVTIGDGVWIGPGAVIGRGVTLGAGCVVGAGAVVVGDVPPGTLVVGVPARVRGDAPTM